jgi:hypothetical protein
VGKPLIVDGQEIRLQLSETEDDRTRLYDDIHSAEAVLFCYDVESQETITTLRSRWLPLVRGSGWNGMLMLVGAKRTATVDREGTHGMAREMTDEEQMLHTEVALDSPDTIDNALMVVAHGILQYKSG